MGACEMSVRTPKPRPVKYCADCGAAIAGPETPWRVYYALKYCRDCAKERRLYSDANAKRQFRRDRKERNRLLREENTLLRKENSELRRRVAALEKMNQEARGYV